MALSLSDFVARVRAQGALWGLKTADDAWAMHEDPEEGDEAMPVWLDAAAARACAVGEWAGFVPEEIPLAEFLDAWLPALDEEAAWVGIDFAADAQGEMVDPVELADMLSAAR